jgi:hypothetical protein
MTNKNRLTQLICESYQTDGCIAHCNHGPCCTCERIANYLVTSGEVIPPVDVGDKVWYINGGYYNSARLEPREIEVTEISKKKSGKTIDWAFIANRTRYKFSSIGKTVFLTKEDCLAAINKKKSKNFKQHIV